MKMIMEISEWTKEGNKLERTVRVDNIQNQKTQQKIYEETDFFEKKMSKTADKSQNGLSADRNFDNHRQRNSWSLCRT